MEKSKKEVQSTRSDNRMKQMRYLCNSIENTKTTVPHILDPENYDKPLLKDSGYRNSDSIAKAFSKRIDEYMAELNDFASYLRLSTLETFIFTVIAAVQIGKNDDDITLNDINRYLDITGLDSMPFVSVCEQMVHKHYLELSYDRSGDIELNIPDFIIISIRHNDANISIESHNEPLDRYKFCGQVSDLIDDFDQLNRLREAVTKLEDRNQHLEFINKMKSMSIGIVDRIIFYKVAYDCIDGDTSRMSRLFHDIFNAEKLQEVETMKRIKDGSHKLVENDLIEVIADQFFDRSDLTLSENGKEFFFEEDKIVFMKGNGKSDKKLTGFEDIPVRELFYDKELNTDISFLEKSLDVTEFRKLQERMAAKSMKKGVAILFYGAPGTGKTETVMQLARRTGRNVYHVDISANKTCWYGESEKLIKRIFTDYKKMCDKEKNTPILLFNEADALLGKRRNDIHGTCDQTDNAIQNILLEEMENLEGIMIATTNFEGNLDDAFERRFLMKVNFRKPSVESKEAIWHSKLPSLPQSDCHTLAIRYDLSGGEIDNVVRKVTMTEVLQGTTPDLTALCALCEKEKLSKSEHRKVGF